MNIRSLCYAVVLTIATLLPAAHAAAPCDTLDVSVPRELNVGSDIPAATKKVFLVGFVEQFLWEVSGPRLAIDQDKINQLHTIFAPESEAQRARNRLEFRGADGKAIGAPRCIVLGALTATAAAPNPPVVANPVAPVNPASPAPAPSPVPAGAGLLGTPIADCTALVRQHGLPPDNRIVAFNSKGQVCYQEPRTFAQGDPISTLVAVRKGEIQLDFLPADYSPCSLRSASPNVLGKSSDIPFKNLSAATYPNDEIIPIGTRFCYDDNVTITLKKSEASGPVTLGAQTVAQYKRYQASVQLGVLYSDIRDGSFALRSADGQNLIYEKGATNRGPEYTVSVLLHGLPHYFKSGFGYKGRDLVNENSLQDRIGLVLSAGLKNPGDRFGLGLSYEIVRGVNLVVVHEWVKVSELVGLEVGGEFAGTVEQLPVRKTWDKSTSFGVSFDLTYVTQLFTRN